MKLRPLLLIATICLLPLGALAWTTLHEAQGEQLVVRQQFQELFETRLQDVKADVANYFDSLERQLDPVVTLDDFETESLRRISRNSPQILQLFVVSPQGALIYPGPAGTGIGLTIARELARLHGGELQLIDSTIGCHFQATLKTGSAVEHP